MLIEKLEPRTVLSVTVIEGYPGFYEVFGTEGADQIDISVDMDARAFSVQGLPYTNVSFISVHGLGGDDVIRVLTSSPWASLSAAIHGGGGNDQLTLNFDGAIWGGDGNDTIFLSDAFRGEAYAGYGDDIVQVSGENIEAIVYGEIGNDIIVASGNHHGIYLYGGSGSDFIYGSPYADFIDGGNGMDTLYGGGGNDTLYGGNGDDRFVAWWDDTQVHVIGGEGYDELYHYQGVLTASGVEQIYTA